MTVPLGLVDDALEDAADASEDASDHFEDPRDDVEQGAEDPGSPSGYHQADAADGHQANTRPADDFVADQAVGITGWLHQEAYDGHDSSDEKEHKACERCTHGIP